MAFLDNFKNALRPYDDDDYIENEATEESFAALAEQEGWDRETWEEELRVTLSHELTHHMESRGGLHALDDRDAAELAAWKQEYGL